jgi:hypothetical protein
MIFVLNLSLQPNEIASAVSADAEDAAHRHYNLTVEYVGNVPGEEWLSATILKLDQDMSDAGDVLIQLAYHGVLSNRVRIGVGHVGGGPADDPGAGPTPAPPYTINGIVTLAGAALNDVTVNLGGQSNAVITTNSEGKYSFVVTETGSYVITPSKRFFSFSPASLSLSNLANNQTANLFATRDTFTINGIVRDDRGNALTDVSVKLDGPEGFSKIVITGDDGGFSVKDTPAGFDYTVSPVDTSLFAFTPQTLTQLSQDQTVAFNGVLRSYTISGFISDRELRGVSGVNVLLAGGASAATTTDANGNYSFSNLLAGKAYSVTAAKTDHYINPTLKNINLLRDEKADFSAIRFYNISGRVVDPGNHGLLGMQLSLSGPESSMVRTNSDGLFSFTVTTKGDYLLTPSREQDLYQFSPASQSLPNLSDHQTINFTGSLTITNPAYVLEFDGSPMAVDSYIFWPTDTNLGQFFWEVWAMPGPDNFARYMLSDGYGGAHAILFGFTEGYPGRYGLTGNVWNGTTVFSFRSDDGPSVGEWGHFAVGWDGNSIITYYDGVPVGKQDFTGPRVSTGTYNGATFLFVGGSSHQNFNGRIAQIRGYEENDPRASAPENTFKPQTVFSPEGQLLNYYFRPSLIIADLSAGYNGKQHDGLRRSMVNYFQGCPDCPLPRFVLDPTAPDFANMNNPGQTNTLVGAPATPPSGALVFDSFSRNNSTYILNGKGGLGVTEIGGGTWRTNVDANLLQPFGILAARAVLLGNEMAMAWVPVNSSTGNLEVRVERKPGSFGSGANTGLCFRVADKDNFFFAYSHNDASNPSGPKKLTIGYLQSGSPIILGDNVAMPPNWTALRVITAEQGSISVYADQFLVYSTSTTVNSLAHGAGLFNPGAGMALQNRWDNFTVLNAQ